MNIELTPGSPADRSVVADAHERLENLRTELTRVRAAALAWRNGIAGLLAALLGFSLIRGRSDIGQLAAPWNIVTGLVLLAALAVGTFAAFRLLRAAHGRPTLTPIDTTLPEIVGEHVVAVGALRDLAVGIRATLGCVVLLVGAVAITWYGPARPATLRVTTPGATVCGTVTNVDHGRMTLSSTQGPVTVGLAEAIGIQAVSQCP